MNKNRHIVVVGGTGYIGEYVVAMLRTHDVAVSVIGLGVADQYDSDVITDIVWLAKPDGLSIKEFFADYPKTPNLKRIFYASTALIYPESGGPHNEKVAIDPLQKYEKDKVSEEMWISDFAKKNGALLTIMRFANVYGGIKNRGFVFHLMNALLSGDALRLNGDGTMKRDFIHIEDLVKYIEFLVFSEQVEARALYNLVTGNEYSLHDLISIAEKVSVKKISVEHRDPIIEKKGMSVSPEKILKKTGFRPHYDIKTGLTKTYTTFKEHYEV